MDEPGMAIFDSFGGDASNLALSQKRSDAVTQYLNTIWDTPGNNKISFQWDMGRTTLCPITKQPKGGNKTAGSI